MRNPKTIAADLAAQAVKASSCFVPQNVDEAVKALSEFATSVAATLDAAGLIEDERPSGDAGSIEPQA